MDSGDSTPISRRTVLRRLTVLLAQAGLWSMPLSLQTRAFAASAPVSLDGAGFLSLSQTLTGRQTLSAVSAQRIYDLLSQDDPGFAKAAVALAALSRGKPSPEALLAAATPLGLRAAVLNIVSAWYTGTVGLGPTGRLVAYREALMYEPVRDGLTVPTYCSNGPLWWTADVPAIGVTPPQASAVLPSAHAVNRNR